MGFALTVLAIGLWFHFLAYRWGVLGRRAAGDPAGRELVTRFRLMGRAAPKVRIVAWVIVAIAAVVAVASIL